MCLISLLVYSYLNVGVILDFKSMNIYNFFAVVEFNKLPFYGDGGYVEKNGLGFLKVVNKYGDEGTVFIGVPQIVQPSKIAPYGGSELK